MRDFFNHVKRIVIADTKLFFYPYVAVGGAVRRAFRLIKDEVRKGIA